MKIVVLVFVAVFKTTLCISIFYGLKLKILLRSKWWRISTSLFVFWHEYKQQIYLLPPMPLLHLILIGFAGHDWEPLRSLEPNKNLLMTIMRNTVAFLLVKLRTVMQNYILIQKIDTKCFKISTKSERKREKRGKN